MHLHLPHHTTPTQERSAGPVLMALRLPNVPYLINRQCSVVTKGGKDCGWQPHRLAVHRRPTAHSASPMPTGSAMGRRQTDAQRVCPDYVSVRHATSARQGIQFLLEISPALCATQ